MRKYGYTLEDEDVFTDEEEAALKEAEFSTAYDLGARACQQGITKNPYVQLTNPNAWEAWEQGWTEMDFTLELQGE